MLGVGMSVGGGSANTPPDGSFVGDGAESGQPSPDGLLYTFKLKKTVLFHDGTKGDATAVKFSIDRLMDPGTKSGMRACYEPVHSVESLDNATVKARLRHPYESFHIIIAAYPTRLVIITPTDT